MSCKRKQLIKEVKEELVYRISNAKLNLTFGMEMWGKTGGESWQKDIDFYESIRLLLEIE